MAVEEEEEREEVVEVKVKVADIKDEESSTLHIIKRIKKKASHHEETVTEHVIHFFILLHYLLHCFTHQNILLATGAKVVRRVKEYVDECVKMEIHVILV
jgi:hypothetical protein